MMMAKVISVQLVSMLGFDLLFQDVDIVWYKNPLTYFSDPSLPAHKFDVFFQDDGGHSVRYAPYSANSTGPSPTACTCCLGFVTTMTKKMWFTTGRLTADYRQPILH